MLARILERSRNEEKQRSVLRRSNSQTRRLRRWKEFERPSRRKASEQKEVAVTETTGRLQADLDYLLAELELAQKALDAAYVEVERLRRRVATARSELRK